MLSRGLSGGHIWYAHQCVDHPDHVVEVSFAEMALRDLNTMEIVARQEVTQEDQGWLESGARCNPGAERPLELATLAELGVAASSQKPADLGSVRLQPDGDENEWMPGLEATDGITSTIVFNEVNRDRLHILAIENGPEVEPSVLERPTLRAISAEVPEGATDGVDGVEVKDGVDEAPSEAGETASEASQDGAGDSALTSVAFVSGLFVLLAVFCLVARARRAS